MAKPKKVISAEKATKLQDYWCKTRGKAIDSACGYEDCREFWYSLDELEEYIKYVKKKAKGKYKGLGLRIYLGTYPPEGDKHDGLSTIFLAPTAKKKKPKSKGKEEIPVEGDDDQDNIYDIEPLNQNQGGWPPINYDPSGN